MKILSNALALNTLRETNSAQQGVNDSIKKLSSGQRVHTPMQAPAALIAANQLNAHRVGTRQAFDNTEESVTLIQTAEGGLTKINDLLTKMKQISLHAANGAVNDSEMREANQMEIEHLLGSVDRITQNTQFNSKRLLDGSMGTNGTVVGDNLRFVGAAPDSPSSPLEGFPIDITEIATRAYKVGSVPVTVNSFGEGFQVTLMESGKMVTVDFRKGKVGEQIQHLINKHNEVPERFSAADTSRQLQQIIEHALRKEVEDQQLKLDVRFDEQGILNLQHTEYGDHVSFSVACSSPGIITTQAQGAESAEPGQDVQGRIAGDNAEGHGQYLTAPPGSNAQGVSIRYTYPDELTPEPVLNEAGLVVGHRRVKTKPEQVIGNDQNQIIEGYVHLQQQSATFQIGYEASEQNALVSMPDVTTSKLGRDLDNQSSFESLRDIDVSTVQGAFDASKLINKATDEISIMRGELGSFQRNRIERTLDLLSKKNENLAAAQSVIQDTDVAEEVATLAREQLKLNASQAMLTQANQEPGKVLGLIN
ncbi:MAG: flagellin [SAR324 cluster bacterium]|nr:flagellin [SAR324 cluster bacterium]